MFEGTDEVGRNVSVLSSAGRGSSGLRTFQESMEREVRNVPQCCPVYILDWLRLFLYYKDTIHLFQSHLLRVPVFSSSLVLDKHPCDKPE